MLKHFNIVIKGKVHGVGYRFSCMERAYKLGIRGFVRNLDDGSVYIEAEGEEDTLNQFTTWCKKGPVWANVREFHIVEGDVQHFSSFEIVRV